MSAGRINNHGPCVWQARVAYRGLRKAAFRPFKEAARAAEAELLGELKAKASAADQVTKLARLTLMRLHEIRLLRREMGHLEQGVVMLPRAQVDARPVIISG